MRDILLVSLQFELGRGIVIYSNHLILQRRCTRANFHHNRVVLVLHRTCAKCSRTDGLFAWVVTGTTCMKVVKQSGHHS
ncbi:hypothetical protein TNIN_161981 [Trichonephila inaurata madagascariensis]|uniref:Uncharacterized protein n=1 Tax=Trichonephila inaurata madagascariensis TaxID=2747483 RepID=A0A8X6J4T5_9ARAC|nr:hypothetical protein TNIN_161981 [Trichonephila inaurata madagascariensis]